MSNIPSIGFVVEGATDIAIIKQIITRFLGDQEFRSVQIQPIVSDAFDHLGLHGGGWKGVFRWCESNAVQLAVSNNTYVIIHLDAEVAQDKDKAIADLGLAANCPPASVACTNLRAHIKAKLGGSLPPNVVLCIPAQTLEAWIVAALHPDLAQRHAPIECRPKPETLLIGRNPRLGQGKNGKLDKDVRAYTAMAVHIAAQWDTIKIYCTQAEQFETDFRAVPIPN